MNSEMDHDGFGSSSMRRQRTFEIVDSDNPNKRRHSSHLSNGASVTVRKSVESKKSSTASHSSIHKDGSIEKQGSTTVRKNSSAVLSLSKKESSIAKKDDPKRQLSSQGSLSKQLSKSNSSTAKAVLISRLSKQSSQQSVENGVELWYPKDCFVATRAPDDDRDSYYICKVLQDIYNYTKTAKVRWLDRLRDGPQRKYKMKYLDTIDPACILIEVELTRISHLFYIEADNQPNDIHEILCSVKALEKGDQSIDDIGQDVHEVVQIDEPPKKKAKLTKAAPKKDSAVKKPKKKAKLVKTASKKVMKKAKKAAQKKEKADKKPRKKKEKAEKEPKRKKPKKEDELKLNPRPDVKVLEKDPLFETLTPMPYISKRSNSKLIFRAIYMKDAKLLKKLLKDKNIYLLLGKSVDCDISPVEASVRVGNQAIFELLLQEFCGSKFEDRKDNNYDDKVSLDKLQTGRYNAKSLGISSIRKIQASRGSKEGNNAFVKEEESLHSINIQDIFNQNVAVHDNSEHLIKEIMKFLESSTEEDFYSHFTDTAEIVQLALKGQIRVAGKMVTYTDAYFQRRTINQLMKEVLTLETQELSGCAPSSVKFASKRFAKLTPFHLAAINPNPKYLEKLLSVEPLTHITDIAGRRPIHLAACCRTTDNIELLLKWGANLTETCQKHQTPLHYAILARRTANVKYLLQKGKENKDISQEKFGVGGISRPFPDGMSPLQRAIQLEESDMIEVLLSYGALVNAKSSVSSMQIAPIMTAAATGNLGIVKMLVKHGAVVEQKDRLGRTALIHACMNGATKVLSYLIHIGSNPERPDSSDNYPIHYAAAYGWYFTLRLLIDVGVDINVLNMWKFSPIAVAYMKGHVGIVRELLMNDKVDINQRMEDGTSLLFQACESDLCQSDLYQQIEFLVKTKGADCSLRDNKGKTALFYLASSVIEHEEKVKEAEKQSIKIADLLIENGCDLDTVDDNGFNATMEALGRMVNLVLAENLLKAGGKLLCPPDVGPDEEPKDSFLHRIMNNLCGNDIKLEKVLQLLTKYKFEPELKTMAQHVNALGYTPLLYAFAGSSHDKLFGLRPEHFDNIEIKQEWDGQFKFLKYLITKCNPDVNAKVMEKFIPLKERLTATSLADKYYDSSDGGKTALHLLLKMDPELEHVNTRAASNASLLISLLVGKGADVNYHDVNGLTPIGTAADEDYASAFSYLVKHAKGNINTPNKLVQDDKTTVEELSLNMFVVQYQNHNNALDVVLALINNGIDVNARSQVPENVHGTFLHILFQLDDIKRTDLVKIVDKLLATPFDFDAQDDEGRTVLHYAFRSNTNKIDDSLELESKLISRCSLSVKDFKQKTPLHYIFKQSKEVYHYSWRNDERVDPSQILRLACQTADKNLINAQDYNGKSILHLAAENGFFVSIYLLTERKDKPNVYLKDINGNTPLALAVKNKHESCALALLQCGSSLQDEVFTVSDNEKVRRKKERQAKRLQTKSKKKKDDDEEDDTSDEDKNDTKMWTLKALRNVKAKEAVSKIPLYKAAITLELTGTMLQIIDAPKDKSGLSHKDMIWLAMESGKYNVALQIMHTSRSDPKTASLLRKSYEKGRNLLHLLPLSNTEYPDGGYHSMTEIAKLLLSVGLTSGSVDDYGCTPIQYALLNRLFEVADYLAENGSGYEVKKQDKFGRGYLAALLWRVNSRHFNDTDWTFLAKFEGKIDLNALIDLPLSSDMIDFTDDTNSKIDPDYWKSYPESKTTALIACISTIPINFNIVYNLLAFGANPNTPDGNKVTPLMHAVMQNKADYVRQLLHYDYDPDENETAVHRTSALQKRKQKLNTSVFRLKAAADSDGSDEESNMDEEEDEETDNKKSMPKEYRLVLKTSQVKLDQKDGDGRTALHYVASPSPLGTFDNPELAFILIKGGAKSTPDKFGFTPFTLAVETCALNVIEKLKELGQGSHKSFNIQYNDSFPVNDGLNFDAKPDFQKDADKILKRQDSGMVVDDVYVHEVDENCHVTDGELMKDEELGVWLDILMAKIDVKRLHWGLYNFYKMQLVYQPDKKLYILFTRWGCIGDQGQFQHTPFQDKEAAINEFAKIFKEKSGNKWIDIKSYERKPNKYRLLEDVARKAPPEQKDIKLDLVSNVAHKLPQYLFSIINKLMSPKVMDIAMKDSSCVNTASLPFGQLNEERLMQGKQLLERIQKYIEEVEKHKEKYDKGEADKEALEVLTKNCEMIAELSNDYYHVIPQIDFSCENCAPLSNKTIIKHVYFINNMLNYELVSKMLFAAMNNKTKTNPVDFVYSCLDCKVELMTPDDPMSQLILRYIKISSTTTKVCGIYKLKRQGEEERFKATKLGNHSLLWHGTQSTNILSILSRGLLVAPPEASSTAWAYGKGIYFADEFSKSSHYTQNSSGKRVYIFLCQVALGNCVPYDGEDDERNKTAKSKRQGKAKKNSTVAESSDEPKFEWLVLNSGVKIPYRQNPNNCFDYSQREYIIEDPAQACLRYLIEYKD